MLKVKSYQDLIAWQKAISLTKEIYTITSGFPKVEQYGLVSQMRRASVSIPANIAEGQARNTKGEFKQFLGIASGSLAELETLTILSGEFCYLSAESLSTLQPLQAELGKILNGLLKSLE